MENYKIIEIIKEIKRGDMSNFQAIYDVFSRLINYYGKKSAKTAAEILHYSLWSFYIRWIRTSFTPMKATR